MGDNAAPSRFPLARRLDEPSSRFVSNLYSTIPAIHKGPTVEKHPNLLSAPGYGSHDSHHWAHTR